MYFDSKRGYMILVLIKISYSHEIEALKINENSINVRFIKVLPDVTHTPCRSSKRITNTFLNFPELLKGSFPALLHHYLNDINW